MFKVAHNGTDRAVAVDAEGRQIGAGEWGVANTTDDVAVSARDRGALTLLDVAPGDGINPDAAAARDRAAELNARADALQAADKPVLEAAAAGLGLPEGADKPLLVRALALAGVDVEAAQAEAAQADDGDDTTTKRGRSAARSTAEV